ncbi:MAG: hypothetical protein ACYCUZ_05805 [Cuniculiplasma sp.]
MNISKREYPDKNVDMENLSAVVERYFIGEGFVVKLAFDQDKAVIQARKGGVFRTMLEMDRSFTTIFQRKNGHIEMSMGVAKTLDSLDSENIKNIYHGIFIEIPEAIWAYEIEHHLWNAIEMYLENQ